MPIGPSSVCLSAHAKTESVELHHDTIRKSDEKATTEYVLNSPDVVLTSFLTAFAKSILIIKIGLHSKPSGFYPTCSI